MRAVRDNELAASAAGVDVFRTKVVAFALCAALGGLGGGLFAGGFAYVSPDQFAFADSIVLLTMALLGGVASPIGSAIGTGLLILIPEWLRFLKSVPGLYLAIYGVAVILIVIFMPDGIWGFVASYSRPRAARSARAMGEPLELAPADSGSAVALEVRGLSKYFGGLKAVDEVDFTVRRGGVHALIGPNGSRQDDDAQRRHRPLSRERGRDPCRRRRRHPPAAAQAHRGRASRARSRTSACSARCPRSRMS